MSKQHCRSNWQVWCQLLRYFAVLGNNAEATFDLVEATFDFIAFDNVASTLLLVWRNTAIFKTIFCTWGFPYPTMSKSFLPSSSLIPKSRCQSLSFNNVANK